jgi:hypothetical protein
MMLQRNGSGSVIVLMKGASQLGRVTFDIKCLMTTSCWQPFRVGAVQGIMSEATLKS